MAIAVWLVPWLDQQCATLPTQTLTAGCAEYWLHRYQTLVAGLLALFAALLVVREARRHLEVSRADQAERMLTALADAIVDIMQKHQAVWAIEPSQFDAHELLQRLEAATNRAEVKSGLVESLMGGDAAMLALYINHCRFSATRRTLRRDDQVVDSKSLWPLYVELTDSINQRKAALRNGANVSMLFEMSFIDRAKMTNQFQVMSTDAPV
jgi:hypothetical protein